tara:strand:- start:2339 stop:3028 length:690 start_codon:yes stop_codon:yes gene_type:complete
MKTKLEHFKSGIIQELPLQIGVFPFGLIYGILAIESGLSVLQAFLMSSIIFAGASQIVFAQFYLLVSPLSLITSITSINLRHLLYGISINEYMKGLSLKWRIVLSYLLTDEAYAISIKYFATNKNEKFMHYHLLGSGLTLFFTWQISTFFGIFFGQLIPENINLSFIIPLTFIAIITPMIKKKYEIIACLASGLLSVLFFKLNFELWIILSSLISLFFSIPFIKKDSKK